MYKLSADNKFSEHQRVRTEGAVDVTHILIRSLNLLIFANNRGDSINSPQKSWVYRWDSTTQMFFKHSELDTFRVRKMSAFIGSDDTGMIFFVIFSYFIRSLFIKFITELGHGKFIMIFSAIFLYNHMKGKNIKEFYCLSVILLICI